jgi:metallo-beta-lactamase class B
MVIHDGDKLRLGDTSVTLYVTPGHTPGTLSALIPVHEGHKLYRLSLLGGTAFPRTLEPTRESGGLIAFSASIERLSKLSQAAGAVGIINSHIFADGSTERLAKAHARQADQPNPFILGTDAVARYYSMFDECLKAASERPPTQIDIKAISEGTEH